jgi:hypothetical protein
MRTALVAILGLFSIVAYASDTPDAGAPTTGASLSDAEIQALNRLVAASRITAPSPRLPKAFTAAHPKQVVEAKYKICIGMDGKVSSVTPMQAIGDADADTSVMSQLKATWLYKPLPRPVCFAQPFKFNIN